MGRATMGRTGSVTKAYGFLALLLLFVGAISATLITSCGGGGGDATGGLCSQCGDSPDGPCLSSVFVEPGPAAPSPCNVPGAANPCGPIELTCLRKLGSAQRRCFPFQDDPFFECDGARPGGTQTPRPTATPTATPVQSCGNGVREGTEQCDAPDFDEKTCADFCQSVGGTLGCTSACVVDFSLCNAPATCQFQ